MSYKIAIASSDEINIDETFGAANRFLIYEVAEDGYQKIEERSDISDTADGGCASGGCASGGCGGGSGCGGGQAVSEKVELISDCRCVVCKKIGFNIQKQLERKAISAFDVDCTIEEALKKISFYFSRTDRHQSLRGLNTSN